jgi:Saf4/Yju2 protein
VEITFTTDWKNADYTCERGAKRSFEPWRDYSKMAEVNETDEERLDQLQMEEPEEEEEEEERELQERDAMAELEQKRMDNKRDMQIAETLDEIRIRNARTERGERGGAGENALARIRRAAEEQRSRIDQEHDEIMRKAFVEVKAWCD